MNDFTLPSTEKMMGESGLINQNIAEESKPVEPVAGDTEESGAKPQAADNLEEEVIVEIDADQQQEAKEAEPDYKVMARQKHEKMKKQREAREKAEAKNKELEERLAKAERVIAEVTAGKKPDPSDFEYDPEGYASALREWEAKRPKEPEKAPNQNVVESLADEVEEFAIESAEKMKTVMPGYDDSEQKLKSMIADRGSNIAAAMNQLADLTYGEEIDYAQAVVGLAEVPGALDRVMNAKSHGVLKRALKEAAAKVKITKRQKIDTKPEPEITSTGNVSSMAAQIEAAKQKWIESKSADDYKSLQALRAKSKKSAAN